MATAKSTPPPRRLTRWTLTIVSIVVVIAAVIWAFGYIKPYLPAIGNRDGEKRAAMELCWQERGTTKQGIRIDGGACDALDRLFMPKITPEAYGVYNPNASTQLR
ncbi:hypothetical protein BH10PSE18_BH10PSE18_04970 [soil metagenome]